MNKEFLYMQKLAGLITESEYATKIEELEVTGKVGKQYAAPGYEDEVKGNKTKIKRALEKNMRVEKFKKIVFDLYNDASQGLIFVSEFPERKNGAVFVDENSKYKYLLTGERNPGLGEIPYMHSVVLPKSEATSSPYKLDIRNFHKIIRAVLQSEINGANYHVNFFSDGLYKQDKFGGGGGDMIQIGYVGYVVDSSKFSRDGNPDFGFPQEIGNGMAWVSFRFRN